MQEVLIENGMVITMDSERRVLEPGSVLVRGERIVAVGEPEEVARQANSPERIDARRMAVIPGLIDSHGHAGHGLIKSLGAGQTDQWVDACLKVYATGSSANFWEAEARLVSLERLKAGVTTSVSLFGGGTDLIRNDTPEYALKYLNAVGEGGTRAYLAVGPNRPPFPHRFLHLESGVERRVDLDGQMETVRELVSSGSDLHDGRVGVCLFAPVFGRDQYGEELEESLVADILQRVMDLREESGLLYTQDGHRSGSIAYADRFDAVGPWSLFSHSIDLTEDDMRVAQERGATIVHNPSANMSIRGRCPVPELINLGVNVVLGSDGAAPDRGYDMFRHMAQCMHYHRRHFRDADVLPAGKTLELVTIDAAKGLGREDELGSLEIGKRADIVLVDLFKPHLVPINLPVMRLTHFANAADVHTVLVDGRVIMRGREAVDVDETAVLEEAEAEMARVLRHNELEESLRYPANFWRESGLKR